MSVEMKQQMKLVQIPKEVYSEYKYRSIFEAYKWDPQVEDHNTVAKDVLVIEEETALRIEKWAEELSLETMCMEEAFFHKLHLAKQLGLPKKIYNNLSALKNYKRNEHVRLMRFDFHPTEEGWAISEVNSDVPGGLAEASVAPQLVNEYIEEIEPFRHTGEALYKAFAGKVPSGGKIAFVHATSYSDDRQVMQFLGDYFEKNSLQAVYAAPDHLKWESGRAVNIIEGAESKIDGIVRFFPLEWLANLPAKSNWQAYYNCITPSCNHPIAILTQSKRLPLVWNELGCNIQTWRQLLPETKNPKEVDVKDENWIFKPALGRVGEGISIREAAKKEEMQQIMKAVKAYPQDWVAQRKFKSVPLLSQDGIEYHLCVGAFTVDGKGAGLYARISPYPRIDGRARDIPVLIVKKENENVK